MNKSIPPTLCLLRITIRVSKGAVGGAAAVKVKLSTKISMWRLQCLYLFVSAAKGYKNKNKNKKWGCEGRRRGCPSRGWYGGWIDIFI